MDDVDQWPIDNPDTIKRKCDICGKKRPVQQHIDPFVIADIIDGDKDATLWWCRSCYENRRDDI